MILSLLFDNNAEEQIILRQSSSFFHENRYVVVYQDFKYRFILKEIGDLRSENIYNILINGEEQEFWLRPMENEIEIVLTDSKPFYLVYGVTDISIVINEEEEERVLISSPLVVAIRTEFNTIANSVRLMLDEIYKKDHVLLQKKRLKNDADKIIYNGSSDKFQHEIDTLKKITIILKHYLPNFINKPRVKTIERECVDNFEKLHSVKPNTLRYIALNPQELKKQTIARGINVSGNHYLPQKTLINMTEHSKNTFENRKIVEFINTILQYVQEKLNVLEDVLNKHHKEIISKALYDGYILSNSIIDDYLKYAFNEYRIQLSNLSKELMMLATRYKSILVATNDCMKQIVIPTSIFLEVHQYRKVYECMVEWFSMSKPELPSRQTKVHFYNADKVYEYYSLLCIGDILSKLGFEEDSTKRILYPYEVYGWRHYQQDLDCNTFLFKNNCGKEITLYFQPCIYTDRIGKENNGITLFRVNGSRKKFFTPDFILKIVDREKNDVRYGVLDSKWQTRKSILNQNNELKDCMFKYLSCVMDERTLSSADFLWLLQGKDDNEKKIFFQRNGHVSKSKKDTLFDKRIGIVTLTPDTGILELQKVLSTNILGVENSSIDI